MNNKDTKRKKMSFTLLTGSTMNTLSSFVVMSTQGGFTEQTAAFPILCADTQCI